MDQTMKQWLPNEFCFKNIFPWNKKKIKLDETELLFK